MRIVGNLDHDQCKITIFKSDNRYSVKIENRLFEETYKLRSDQRIDGLEAVKKIISEDLIQGSLQRFSQMRKDLDQAVRAVFPPEEQEEFEEII